MKKKNQAIKEVKEVKKVNCQCKLHEENRLHQCQHSLHFRKTERRCEYLSSDKKARSLWCDRLELNKTPKLKFHFMRAVAKASGTAKMGK